MDNNTLSEQVQKKRKKIRKQLISCGADSEKVKLLETVIEHIAFMSVKLEETKDMAGTTQIVISYNNGGGQKGIRENPIYRAYESLWKSYMSGIDRLLSLLPEDEQNEIQKKENEKHATVLEIVRGRHSA